ncbi:MAG: hypothetical protein HYZ84_06230 [Candidatus Omnitrophica bacterium]|nr:hypothetical protein [Candidatus Omnitrophota bacterium]
MKFLNDIWVNPWVWTGVALLGFGLCTLLPIAIKDQHIRTLVNRLVLIPVSLILIFYVYPAGLEIFRRWAVHF